jgi:hypothetical protein
MYVVVSGELVGSTLETGPCVLFKEGDTFGERCINAATTTEDMRRQYTVTAETKCECLCIAGISLARYQNILRHHLQDSLDFFERRTDPLKGRKVALFAYMIFLVLFQLVTFAAHPTGDLYKQNQAVTELFSIEQLTDDLADASDHAGFADALHGYLNLELLPMMHAADAPLLPGDVRTMRLEFSVPFLESLNGKGQSIPGERSRKIQTHRIPRASYMPKLLVGKCGMVRREIRSSW